MGRHQKIAVHKKNTHPKDPLVSVVLLDRSVRESLHVLNWLSKQDTPRENYELIWVECYNRVAPEAMEKADVVITCNQKGMYSTHKALNVGYLNARGQIVTNCDSDAVFPPDFITSIIKSYTSSGSNELKQIILMHDEFRNNKITYPHGISNIEEIKNYSWLPLWKNAGACTSFRKIDAIRFGGWDEHKSFRGLAGGDLLWRLINAGIPPKWHDESVVLYHFAHPHPKLNKGFSYSFKMWREIQSPYFEGLPLLAVEAFATGRLLPLKENLDIHKLRLSLRPIGTRGEHGMGSGVGISGFTTYQKIKIYLNFYKEKIQILIREFLYAPLLKPLKRRLRNKYSLFVYRKFKNLFL